MTQDEYPGGLSPQGGKQGGKPPQKAGLPVQEADSSAKQPPVGSYPLPPGVQPALPGAPVFAPRPEKIRRVGRITTAITLIVFGVLMIAKVLFESLDIWLMLRFSPVLLVLLGAEMLLANRRYPEERLRYDGFSVLMSLVLVGGSLLFVLVSGVLMREYQEQRLSGRLAYQLQNNVYQRIEKSGGFPFFQVDFYVHPYGLSIDPEMQPENIPDSCEVGVNLHLRETYSTKEAFANDCYRMINELKKVTPHIDYAYLYSQTAAAGAADGASGRSVTHVLVLQGSQMLDATAEQMAALVEEDVVEETPMAVPENQGDTDDADQLQLQTPLEPQEEPLMLAEGKAAGLLCRMAAAPVHAPAAEHGRHAEAEKLGTLQPLTMPGRKNGIHLVFPISA